MTHHHFFALTAFLCLVISACQERSTKTGHSNDQAFNAELAAHLGADEYGMRSYTLVLLSSGDSVIADQTRLNALQEGHLANIRRLADAGRLALAGPFYDTKAYRGLFVLATENRQEAQDWVKSDPAIAAGLLRAEFFPWYGSAALMQVSAIHQTIEKEQPE